jgi:hypothetical protein
MQRTITEKTLIPRIKRRLRHDGEVLANSERLVVKA